MDLPVWAEITSLEHGHGGVGWELGACLWSPGRSKDDAKRYGVMMLPAAGDKVVHFVSGVDLNRPRDRYFLGMSRVAASAVELENPPPAPGVWAGSKSYYRIALAEFVQLSSPLPMTAVEEGLADVILADLVRRPKYYPYAPYRSGFRGAQGIYLTLLSSRLAGALAELGQLGLSAEAPTAPLVSKRAMEYAEGQRLHREVSYFRRNPALRAAAIARHGVICAACGFDFETAYGSIGAGYIEMHHLDPLAERVQTEEAGEPKTNIDDIIPLCANCHRVVHKYRPALTIEELRLALAS